MIYFLRFSLIKLYEKLKSIAKVRLCSKTDFFLLTCSMDQIVFINIQKYKISF